jgi:hypothetical protein
VVRDIRVFLNPERIIRNGRPEPGARTAVPKGPGGPGVSERTNALAQKLKRAWWRRARKGRVLAMRARSRLSSGEAGGIEAGNVVWIFGSGRTGSTWLSSMMEEIEGQTVWREPLVGALFGDLYYVRAAHRTGHKTRWVFRRGEHFILGRDYEEAWFGPMRDLVLGGAVARFPELAKGGYLVIKEPNGSIGAPLLMEAMPESRMIFLIRDPRDIVASHIDARKGGSWLHEERKKDDQRRVPPVDENPDVNVKALAKSFLQNAGNAKMAYDAHNGRKVLVKYEELRADTLGTMKRIYSALEIPVNEKELLQAVEQHAWEAIPEENKGEGKFYRKATPGGWRKDLTPRQARLVEHITSPLLKEFYPEDTP